MKKIFTLAASVMLVASAFAQYNPSHQKDRSYDRDGDVVYNDRRQNDGRQNDGRYNDDWKRNDHHNNGHHRNDYYSFSIRERDMQIAQINREYDHKIHDVTHRAFMSHYRQNRIIRSYEDQRRNEIRMVFAKFNHQSNRYNNRDYRRH